MKGVTHGVWFHGVALETRAAIILILIKMVAYSWR